MPRPILVSPTPDTGYAGIDVAADTLELCLLAPDCQCLLRKSFHNTPAGIKALARQLAKQSRAVRVCLEPTSRYHERLARALVQLPCCHTLLANPRQVRDFARSLGCRAKTDRADAAVLAQMAARLPLLAYQLPSPLLSELELIVDRMNALRRHAVQEKCRLKLLQKCGGPACVLQDLKAHLAYLQRRGEALKIKALALVKGDPQLNRHLELLVSIKGIAEVAGLQLMARLERLPAGLTKGQWVAQAGLDPQPQESGTSHKPRRISRRGDQALRHALFMPAQVAALYCPPIRDYYQRLLARGKKPLQALAAVMAKLLHIIWAMWQSDELFDPAKLNPRSA